MVSLDERVVGYEERLKRARNIRKNEFKLQRRREQLKRHFAKAPVLAKRAQMAAKDLLRRKIAGLRKSKSTLSISQRLSVDKLLAHISHKKINSIAKKLLPRVVRKEKDRVKRVLSKMNESYIVPTGPLGPVEIGRSETVQRYSSMTPGQRTYKQQLAKKILEQLRADEDE